MASLTIPNIFIPGTAAKASEVNANFDAITNWSQNIDTTNFPIAGFTGGLIFTMANDNAIRIQNNGNDESIKITQGALLGAGKASILITDNQTQTASGAAELKMVLAAGATIPAIHITHGVDTFKVTKDGIKPPAKTTSQRNAIISPEEGSIIYNSTTQQLNEKRNDGWSPVGSPVGSVQMFAGSSAPEGWLLCDGSPLNAVANPKYAALYAVIGINYGGTNNTDFKVPDCRGIFVRGVGSQTIGAETYTGTFGTPNNKQNDATAVNGLVTQSDGSHVHDLYVTGSGGAPPNRNHGGGNNGLPSVILSGEVLSAGSVHNHVLAGDLETRPANIALNYIIKY